MTSQYELRKRYPSDLTDEKWNIIKDDIPKIKSSKKTGGRPEKYPRREIMNAILYIVSSGCRYCDIPHDLPPGGVSHGSISTCGARMESGRKLTTN